MSKKLGGIIVRVILSIVVTCFMANEYDWSVMEAAVLGLGIYSLISYYMIYLKHNREMDDESDRTRGFHYVPVGIIGLFMKYVIVPVLVLCAILCGGTWVVEKILPAAWEKNASLIVNLVLILIPISTDVKTLIDFFQSRKYENGVEKRNIENKESDSVENNSIEDKERVSFKKYDVDDYLNEEFGKYVPDEKEYEDNPSDRKFIIGYQEQLREEGIPSEVLDLMNRSGMTFSQCSDLKNGYELGLTYEQLLRISSPGLKRSERQHIINRTLWFKEHIDELNKES